VRREIKIITVIFALLFTVTTAPAKAYLTSPRISLSDTSHTQANRWVLTWDNADVRDLAATFLSAIASRNFQDSGLIVTGSQAKVLDLLKQFIAPAGASVLVEPDIWVTPQKFAVNDEYFPVQWDLATPREGVYGIDLPGARTPEV